VPDGKAFNVQVKGLSGKTGVFIQTPFFSELQENLFLIVVLVPPLSEPYGPKFSS